MWKLLFLPWWIFVINSCECFDKSKDGLFCLLGLWNRNIHNTTGHERAWNELKLYFNEWVFNLVDSLKTSVVNPLPVNPKDGWHIRFVWVGTGRQELMIHYSRWTVFQQMSVLAIIFQLGELLWCRANKMWLSQLKTWTRENILKLNTWNHPTNKYLSAFTVK